MRQPNIRADWLRVARQYLDTAHTRYPNPRWAAMPVFANPRHALLYGARQAYRMALGLGLGALALMALSGCAPRGHGRTVPSIKGVCMQRDADGVGCAWWVAPQLVEQVRRERAMRANNGD